jgi:hypothetical protein
MGSRAGFSTLLVAGAIVLVVAIALGNGMGNRVLGQVAGRVPELETTAAPTPVESTNDAESRVQWKRTQVLSAATDPGFPDPRVTPEPPQPPPSRPRAAPTRSPSPAPSRDKRAPAAGPSVPYTSPPMPIPLASHPAGETSPPDDGTSTPMPRTSGQTDRAEAPEVSTPTLSP